MSAQSGADGVRARAPPRVARLPAGPGCRPSGWRAAPGCSPHSASGLSCRKAAALTDMPVATAIRWARERDRRRGLIDRRVSRKIVHAAFRWGEPVSLPDRRRFRAAVRSWNMRSDSSPLAGALALGLLDRRRHRHALGSRAVETRRRRDASGLRLRPRHDARTARPLAARASPARAAGVPGPEGFHCVRNLVIRMKKAVAHATASFVQAVSAGDGRLRSPAARSASSPPACRRRDRTVASDLRFGLILPRSRLATTSSRSSRGCAGPSG